MFTRYKKCQTQNVVNLIILKSHKMMRKNFFLKKDSMKEINV